VLSQQVFNDVAVNVGREEIETVTVTLDASSADGILFVQVRVVE
jgi:hypothetical protein